VREQIPGARSIFILPPSKQALETRMRNRGQDSEAVIAQRLAAAREEMSHYHEFDYVVINEQFDQAVQEVTAIFTAQRLLVGQQRHRHASLIEHLLSD
jgi:guanylate kinase